MNSWKRWKQEKLEAGKEEYSKKEGLVAGFVSKEVKYHKFFRFWHQKSA